jgi:hypothetical protein
LKRILIALLFVAGCAEKSESLGNGYRFVELSRGNGAITKNGEFVVYPNVVEHEISGVRIVGRRERAESNSDSSPPFTEGLGYFVLDTSTGELQQGLRDKPSL